MRAYPHHILVYQQLGVHSRDVAEQLDDVCVPYAAQHCGLRLELFVKLRLRDLVPCPHVRRFIFVPCFALRPLLARKAALLHCNFVQEVKDDMKDLSAYGHLVQEVKDLLKSFQDYRVVWVRRSVNKAALDRKSVV